MKINLPENSLVYWRNEQTGQLAIAVRKFFDNEELTENDLELLKAYLSHWIKLSVFPSELIRDNILIQTESVSDRSQLGSMVDALVDEFGIDPF
jgi:hypothetical protein